MRVTIRRDLKKPKFNNNPYTATIPESLEVGRNVDIKPSAIRGTDEDKKVRSPFVFNCSLSKFGRQFSVFKCFQVNLIDMCRHLI